MFRTRGKILLEGDPAISLPPSHPCTKVNPPLRSPEDVHALVEALAEGIVEAVATDHAPHAAADKAGPFETAAFDANRFAARWIAARMSW